MQENYDYKQDVANTRVGCMGSSDGKMLAQIASLGNVPKSALKRLAVCKGLIPQEEIPHTAAVAAGDMMEMLIFKHLSANDPRYESNPLWVSEQYSQPNVKLICHPDFVLKDDARKTLYVYECKTTKYCFADTRTTYKAQLFIEHLIAMERARSYGKDWTAKLFLVHYDTDGLDLPSLLADGALTLDVSRLTVKEVRFTTGGLFDIKKAMFIVNDFLDGFTEYYEGDDVDADKLPASVKTQFDDVAAMLVEINERESKVEAFKQRLYQFMVEKNIRTIKNDVFSITRVDESEAKSFDGKKYLEDMQKNHPRKAKKVLAQYTKVSKRSGYALIKVFTNKS